ncbi:hypothetical protein B296_00001557 [Ensete ventricosum]|uniref:Uncharacterized protein n=1 Tax=Ensete ventricosum TaxID=4639 RepID=A0A426ZHA5_ENSVE|nr:hypothetical protein B296_00001557 [Ensete ventricosum]
MYYLLRSLAEQSCINPKSPTFDYFDEKLVDTDLMKFLGLCPSALSWYLKFVSALSISTTPFTINSLPPWEQGIDDSMEVLPLRYHDAAKPMALLSVALHLHLFLRNRFVIASSPLSTTCFNTSVFSKQFSLVTLKQSNSPVTLTIPLYDQVCSIGLTGTCNLTSPSVVHSPHMLMTKAFIRCKI